MIENILTMGALGCIIFTGFLVFMAYSGIASAMRDEEGNFKKEVSFKAIFGGVLFLSFLLSILYWANFRYANSLADSPGFLQLLLNSFGVFFFIHLYDLIVLDYLVVIRWHPKFLNLPETEYYRTFPPHIKGFVKGIPLGIMASVIASLLLIWTY